EGLEVAWRFFAGVPHRVVLDNFPAAIAGPDALEPRPTRGFLEYSQARGFLPHPARVRHPKDKPHVERTVRYVRERFWKDGRFSDLGDARRQAQVWCLEVAFTAAPVTSRWSFSTNANVHTCCRSPTNPTTCRSGARSPFTPTTTSASRTRCTRRRRAPA